MSPNVGHAHAEKPAPPAERCRRVSGSTTDTVAPEQVPPIRAKTVLAILAVSGTYFAQVYCLVGAGAVRFPVFIYIYIPTVSYQANWSRSKGPV